ncbi:F-box protein KIB4 [Linum perenne]
MAEWQNLPHDLLTSLASEFLDISANVRFSGVCRSWRLAGAQERLRIFEQQIACLIMPPPKQQGRHQQPPCNSLNYISLTDIINNGSSKTKDQDSLSRRMVPWSLPDRSLCIGSFRGRLLVLGYDTKLMLWNPITGSQVPLPKDSRENIKHQEFQAWGYRYNRKVSMWSPNPHYSVSEWYVFLVLPMEKFMTYCRVGDQDWGIMDFRELQQGKQNYVVDALCLDGSLYVLLRSGELYCCDLETGEKKKLMCSYEIAAKTNSRSNYLVELRGEILLVQRKMDFSCGFDVYKLDRNVNQWVEVKELGDLAVLIGFGQPVSVLAESTELGIKRNCIYFLETEELSSWPSEWKNDVCFDICEFDLKTSRIHFFRLGRKFEMPHTGKPVRLPIPIVPW